MQVRIKICDIDGGWWTGKQSCGIVGGTLVLQNLKVQPEPKDQRRHNPKTNRAKAQNPINDV